MTLEFTYGLARLVRRCEENKEDARNRHRNAVFESHAILFVVTNRFRCHQYVVSAADSDSCAGKLSRQLRRGEVSTYIVAQISTHHDGLLRAALYEFDCDTVRQESTFATQGLYNLVVSLLPSLLLSQLLSVSITVLVPDIYYTT